MYQSPVTLMAAAIFVAMAPTAAFVLPQRNIGATSITDKQRIHNQVSSSAPYTSTSLFGIPKMFRWLTDQYPDILSRQLEEGLNDDLSIDNFYLDMNGIIHPATHGNNNDEIIVLDETAMFKKIFLYVDRIYKLVRPQKVLYLAVDGVAPRAKMNQQRSRRFRSAKEAEQLAGELLARNGKLDTSNRFDSNCITPGTDFMLKLSLAMRKWVEFKMETDSFWKDGADVIVSGPDVPGEGEHKVMDFIRESKEAYYQARGHGVESVAATRGHWKPGYSHVLYGLDADLIMLGLITHEPKFMLLREKMSVVMAGRGRSKYRKKKDMLDYNNNDFELLELNLLREMLGLQFQQLAEQGKLKVKYDLDRIVDDFVFMCMLVGNDFLPHTPHLEIDGGALSLMTGSYMELMPDWGGYLTKEDMIHPQRLEQLLYNLAVYEEEHFKRRGLEENEPGWKLTSEDEDEEEDFYGTHFSGKPTPPAAALANRKGSEVPAPEALPMAPTGNRAFRNRHPDNLCRSYRDFYYESKLGWKPQDRSRTLYRRREHVREYLEGLHWCLNYYHHGCMSWNWFFPYLYAPLCTDMVNLHEFYDQADEEGYCRFAFEKGTPFNSLAQLLSVLPPQSASLLPKPLAELMIHPSSPLTEYYPNDFQSDANGKRQGWEAVVQIPFIEADLLLDTVNKVISADAAGQDLLSNAERRRNVPGTTHLFVPPGLTEEEKERVVDQRRRQELASSKGRRRAPVTTVPSQQPAAATKPRRRRTDGQ
ncbi:5'-3' exoribonuclease 1 [Mayamaea pseudoterrestris]|nr:5'-3' exoribonuclease 1 [Mayamaea pseudoterrestris]